MLVYMLYQTTCSMLITVEPKLVVDIIRKYSWTYISVDILLCPKCIVFDICSIQGKWVVLSCPFNIWRSCWVRG